LKRVAAATLVATALAATAGHAARSSTPPLSRLVGQKIMTGIDGAVPDASLLARVRAGEVGGVILFSRNTGSTAELESAIAHLQAAAAAGGNPPLLVAVDQEGGAVKRFPTGPPNLSPAAMGETGSAGKARMEGSATAAFLRRLGINVDLAPVLDTPYGPSSWLGTRAFSRDPTVNARLGAGFVSGLQSGRVAATAKHFPGLGTARATTDTANVVLATPKPSLQARLAPFRAAIAHGVDLVMVSNAGYTAFDPSGVPAVLSPPIVTGLLRGELGFRGVTITDALEAPGPRARADAAVAASKAGMDVLLYVNEADSQAAYEQLLSGARTGTVPRAALGASWTRIQALKRRLT
jgi:beta-N-acetylhexosaminidase